MIGNKTNIIQKQVMNLRYKNKADGFALQKEFTDWYYQELFPEMQSLIDQLAPGHVHVRLEKLELDIVIDATKEWKQVLRKQAIESLGNKLRSEIVHYRTTEETKVTDATGNFSLLLMYYLQKGFLPWWSSIKTKNEFDAILEEWLLSKDSHKYIAPIKNALKDKETLYRATILFDDKSFDLFIHFLTGSDQLVQSFQQLKKDVLAIAVFSPPVKKAGLSLLLKQVILEEIKGPEYVLERIITSFISRSMIQFDGGLKDMDLSLVPANQLKTAFINYSKEKNIFPKKSAPEAEIKMEGKDKAGGKHKKNHELSAELQKGVFVHNAGLVIIASFLPVFFKKLSIVDQNMIRDKDKAIKLVQYLASGKESIAEFELGLAKILCGLELETPVDTTILLSDEEKEEANELLLSVIEHWRILKNTSVEGLRNSFLMRDGKLSFNNNEWLLQVEQKPYDMLLQHLPWNISMIKLSWMESMLKIEWFN